MWAEDTLSGENFSRKFFTLPFGLKLGREEVQGVRVTILLISRVFGFYISSEAVVGTTDE